MSDTYSVSLTNKKSSPYVKLYRWAQSNGLPPPSRELRFHPVRLWRFDYAWPEVKIALEVEGGLWLSKHGKKSRHFTGKGAQGDMDKYNAAAVLGWRILRTTPKGLRSARLLADLKACLIAGATCPDVQPPT